MTISSLLKGSSNAVWLIGAGASISDTGGHFPELLDIPAKARALGLLSPSTDSDGAIQQLSRFLRTRYYGDFTQADIRVDLESVLTLIEIDIAVAPQPRLLLVREFILRLLRRTLAELHAQPFVQRGEYARLVAGLKPGDSVISFNWDLLLDEAFGRSERLLIPPGADSPRLFDDDNLYGRFLIELSAWGERTISRLAAPPPMHQPGTQGIYIKAHGSIDWYYCSDSTCRAFGRVYPMLLGPKKLRPFCPECLVRTSVLIVPPTLNKRMRELPALRRIWGAAANAIEHATAVAVWGYSMPPTDFFSEWLLRHARSKRCEQLVIINPGCISGTGEAAELRHTFVDRFVSALRLPGRSINLAIFETYADYESGRHVGVKYPHLVDQVRRAGRRRKSSIS